MAENRVEANAQYPAIHRLFRPEATGFAGAPPRSAGTILLLLSRVLLSLVDSAGENGWPHPRARVFAR